MAANTIWRSRKRGGQRLYLHATDVAQDTGTGTGVWNINDTVGATQYQYR